MHPQISQGLHEAAVEEQEKKKKKKRNKGVKRREWMAKRFKKWADEKIVAAQQEALGYYICILFCKSFEFGQ
jgi:siroheme synthase (precorrin-2 oxidase/ferrochelatase)